MGDYEFGRGPEDIELLEKMSHVAAAAHAPFLSAASPEMFNLESYTQLDAPRDMAKIFDTTEYAKWKAFRRVEDSRYVAMRLPRILMRAALRQGHQADRGVQLRRRTWTARTTPNICGATRPIALATRMTNAFALYGWCAAIRGVEGGGLVEGLPTHSFHTDDGRRRAEVPHRDRHHRPPRKGTGRSGFRSAGALQGHRLRGFLQRAIGAEAASIYDQESANANARLSTQLPYIMAVSRFAHYLKSMMRDKIGSFMSRSECESFLNRWIMKYVAGSDDVSATIKAQRPLRDARVDVVDVPGKPGVYRAVAFLRPHFQLDELSVSLRLVADLPQAAK